MNWFQKHLNIIVLFSLLVYTLIGILFISGRDAELSFVIWIPLTFLIVFLPSNELGDTVPNVSNCIILAVTLAPAIWAFQQKKRSNKWILLILVPLGWLILFLRTKDTKVAEKKQDHKITEYESQRDETKIKGNTEKETEKLLIDDSKTPVNVKQEDTLLICDKCDRAITPEMAFCPKCGYKLE